MQNMLDPQTIQRARDDGSLYTNWYGDLQPSVDGVVDLLVEGSRFYRPIAIRQNSKSLAPWASPGSDAMQTKKPER